MATAKFHRLTSLSRMNIVYITNIKNKEPQLLQVFIWQARKCVTW